MDWTKIAFMIPGRRNIECKVKWDEINSSIEKSASWTQEEDDLIIKIARRIGFTQWDCIADLFNSVCPKRRRSAENIKDHWQNSLEKESHKYEFGWNVF